MSTLRERFDFKRLSEEARGLLASDFAFEPSGLSTLGAYGAVAQTVDLIESPLAILRHVDLSHRDKAHRTIEVDLVLCIEGRPDALERLAWAVESFQREIPEEAITRVDGLKDFGVGWAWDRGKPDHMVAFVRNNLVVTLFSHEPEDMGPVARELDAALPQPTVDSYSPSAGRVLERVRKGAGGGEVRVQAGSRLELGEPAIAPEDSVFFLATGGSINRDPSRVKERYFRAGLEKGKFRITAFHVGRGLVPVVETLDVEIV